MKIQFRACERCGGDLVPDGWDRFGQTLTCLQCGFDVALSRLTRRAGAPVNTVARESRLEADGEALALGGRQWYRGRMSVL